jgi:hypothetical protein
MVRHASKAPRLLEMERTGGIASEGDETLDEFWEPHGHLSISSSYTGGRK